MEDVPATGKSQEDTDFHWLKEKFEMCLTAEATNRQFMIDDLRFRAASPDEPWQWPDDIQASRKADPGGARPCLTVNYLPQHVLQITNEIRQNRPAIKVLPLNDDADVEIAKVLNGIIRNIENISDADIAYDIMVDNQVTAGEGFVRVVTQYVGDNSFDQELRIVPVPNAMSVYMDPEANYDGSGAKIVFITCMEPKEEIEAEYGDEDQPFDWQTAAQGDEKGIWFDQNSIRTCEAYRLVNVKSSMKKWDTGEVTYDDEQPPSKAKSKGGKPPEPIRTRTFYKKKVVWYKLCGERILETRDTIFTQIPVARAVGNVFLIEGERRVSGIVRNAKDAQRMYNYWTSQEAEFLAMAPRAPFVGAAGQFEGFEKDWKVANVLNLAYLQYNPVLEEGQLAPPPQRVAPPMVSEGLMQAKAGSMADIKGTTHQYEAALGQKSNEVSGRAILYKNREGDTAAFHYGDNARRAIRYLGRILVDAIPKIYDSKRAARVMGEDGNYDFAMIDPDQPEPTQPVMDEASQTQIGTIYNIGIGKYDVAVTTGPSYTTKRQENLDVMTQLIQAQPSLWQVIGDLFVKDLDSGRADEMALRLRATLAPAVQAALKAQEGPAKSPQQLREENMQLHMALQQATQQIQQMMQELQLAKTKQLETAINAHTKLAESENSLQAAQVKGTSDAHVAAITALGNIEATHAQGAADHKTAAIKSVADLLIDHQQNLAQLAQPPAQPQQPAAQGAPKVNENISLSAHPEALGGIQ